MSESLNEPINSNPERINSDDSARITSQIETMEEYWSMPTPISLGDVATPTMVGDLQEAVSNAKVRQEHIARMTPQDIDDTIAAYERQKELVRKIEAEGQSLTGLFEQVTGDVSRERFQDLNEFVKLGVLSEDDLKGVMDLADMQFDLESMQYPTPQDQELLNHVKGILSRIEERIDQKRSELIETARGASQRIQKRVMEAQQNQLRELTEGFTILEAEIEENPRVKARIEEIRAKAEQKAREKADFERLISDLSTGVDNLVIASESVRSDLSRKLGRLGGIAGGEHAGEGVAFGNAGADFDFETELREALASKMRDVTNDSYKTIEGLLNSADKVRNFANTFLQLDSSYWLITDSELLQGDGQAENREVVLEAGIKLRDMESLYNRAKVYLSLLSGTSGNEFIKAYQERLKIEKSGIAEKQREEIAKKNEAEKERLEQERVRLERENREVDELIARGGIEVTVSTSKGDKRGAVLLESGTSGKGKPIWKVVEVAGTTAINSVGREGDKTIYPIYGGDLAGAPTEIKEQLLSALALRQAENVGN